MSRNLKILFVASEVDPFVKTGGLADVAGSLPQKIREMGPDIRVVMPEYGLMPDKYKSKASHVLDFKTRVVWRREYVGVNRLDKEGVPTYFIDNKYFFNRSTLYDNDDKHVQFSYFCRAVLEMLPKIDFKPDIIHFNDWQTGPLALMLDDNYRKYEFYRDIKTVFTIHNLKYQGQFSPETTADVLGVDSWHWYSGNIRHNGLVNFMKAGIMYADKINTVSETYAEEIQQPYFGEGLDYALRMRGNDVSGIINGISYRKFNPETNNDIYFNYSVNNLEGKNKNKKKLQQETGLPEDLKTPLVGIITRLVEQKGLDLIQHIFEEIMQLDLQFILLGTGENKYEEFFQRMSRSHPQKMAALIKYDTALAQKIYAGLDMFLMPSRYEPCGLSQLISMSYGTVPIVKETGGLKDTVSSYDRNKEKGTGFSFSQYNAHEMLDTIKKACKVYKNKKEWKKLQKRIMKLDFSWHKSAQKYISLYKKALDI